MAMPPPPTPSAVGSCVCGPGLDFSIDSIIAKSVQEFVGEGEKTPAVLEIEVRGRTDSEHPFAPIFTIEVGHIICPAVRGMETHRVQSVWRAKIALEKIDPAGIALAQKWNDEANAPQFDVSFNSVAVMDKWLHGVLCRDSKYPIMAGALDLLDLYCVGVEMKVVDRGRYGPHARPLFHQQSDHDDGNDGDVLDIMTGLEMIAAYTRM